jgi:shikimate kinase
MKARATCFGAGTVVNAIATGRGVAFGLALRASATAEIRPETFGLRVDTANGVDRGLAENAALRVRERSGSKRGLAISVDSEIPFSRGLKSSSAVANAVVLASAKALGLDLEPLEMIRIGVDAALEAGVTLTGAFDDACASFFGGIVLTDNHARRILKRDRFSEDLLAVVHIPDRTIPKAGLKHLDFRPIRPQVETAFRLAERGEYFPAMEANSRAYAPILAVDETPAVRAREAGALAAGISGTGPAIVALTETSEVEAVRAAMAGAASAVRVVPLNNIESREVVA